MKIQCIVSSQSGSTKRLADGICAGLKDKYEVECFSLKEVKDHSLDADLFLLGYWVDRGGPNSAMAEFLQSLEGKTVGLFCTLGYFVDSSHGQGSLQKGIDMVKEKNTVLGSFVANGRIDPKIIEMFRKRPMGESHSVTPENELRWALMQDHPTEKEIALATERFQERVALFAAFKEKGLAYKSLT